MGKYSTYTHKPEKPRDQGVHPVMRGIGCILMIAVPILAYGISLVLVDYGVKRGWPIPPAWFGPLTIHPLLWKVQGLQSILQFLEAQPDLEAHLAFTAVIVLVIGGIMTLFYGWVYAIFGPPKYGPQDAPPIRKKVKAYKR
jgi:hypothetical protein